MSRGIERPYISLSGDGRPFAEEHHDAVQLLVIDTLRHFTGTLIDVLRRGASAQEMLVCEQVMEKAYFTSLGGQLRLMGTKEIAEFLGVSHQRVNQLDEKNTQFPQPVARLACGPVWLAQDIERFKATWPRKSGRPKKETEEGKTR